MQDETLGFGLRTESFRVSVFRRHNVDFVCRTLATEQNPLSRCEYLNKLRTEFKTFDTTLHLELAK
jgi:hypothetical protein